MWQSSKLLQSPTRLIHHPQPSPAPVPVPAPHFQNIPIPPSQKLSRRQLTIRTNSSLLLLLASQSLDPLNLAKARAKEAEEAEEGISNANTIDQPQETTNTRCLNKVPTERVFLDISIDKEPKGRIVIGLYGNDVPSGAARFSDLVTGAAGISYRRKEFVKITPSFVQHGGVRSYGIDLEMARRSGSNLEAESLVTEWERANESCPGTKNLEGTVAIIVRNPLKPPPKLKLVAKGGKLEIDEEEVGTGPNGTEFVISMKESPELDDSALVVGRVLEGMDVVEKIGQVKTVQDNTSSPYFRSPLLH